MKEKLTDLFQEINNHFKCEQCGWCCNVHEPVACIPSDIDRLARHIRMPLTVFRRKYIKEHVIKTSNMANEYMQMPCSFFHHAKCSVYEGRPLMCRIFPFNMTPGLEIKVDGLGKCPLAKKIMDAYCGYHRLKKTVDKVIPSPELIELNKARVKHGMAPINMDYYYRTLDPDKFMEFLWQVVRKVKK